MLKTLLILPKKWKTLEKRISNLETYLSRKDRLGSIYGNVKIEYIIQDLPTLRLNSQHVYNEADIKKITQSHRGAYNAIGIIFPEDSSKYAGNYYMNLAKGDHILDFYVATDEKSSHRRRGKKVMSFEEIVEHELSHAVALDLGLISQSTAVGHKIGADNTHAYFYEEQDNLDAWYKELNNRWVSQRSIFQKLIDSIANVIEKLPKKKSKVKIRVIGPDTEMMKKADTLVEIMGLINKPIRVTEAHRNCKRQNELFNQIPKVTNAKCGESYHNYGLAFDVVFRETGYNAPEADWQLLGTIGKALGLNWGGDWKGFVDRPHFEVKMTLKEIREKYEL